MNEARQEEKNLEKIKEKKIDIGIDTNISELKKIRYIEKIAE